MGGELRQVGAEDRRLLVDLLHEAAKLEHCLLDTYLFAACSLKTLPCEFAEVGDGLENRRRAVQFERVRRWKQALLQVAREEMLHLHYVQCMLRALGEGPAFVLPDRDQDGTWFIPDWRLRPGLEDGAGENGAKIPVTPFNVDAISRFVLYESTDSLQDSDPLGAEADVFDQLRLLELDCHLESALRYSDDNLQAKLKPQLEHIYQALGPATGAVAGAAAPATAAAADAGARLEQVRFQSIADLYLLGISPLYQQAFSSGWVVNTNRALDDEIQNPRYGQEGLLPVGPVYRDKNFDKAYRADIDPPMRHFKDVRDIIREIVSEGEGATDFLGRARAMLKKVKELGGTRPYLEKVWDDEVSDTPTPHWLAECQRLRTSHLYRFAVILAEYRQEERLAQDAGVKFVPARDPVDVCAHPALAKLRDDLPGQLNAVYLVLVSWLSRIYETRGWASDKSRRHAIEMLASWPLMSIAIRPLLELVSFFPVDRSRLFRIDADSLPVVPVLSRKLRELYQSDSRSQHVRDRMDDLALGVLSGVAQWAALQVAAVEQATLPESRKAVILARLRLAAQLSEVEKQFPYRVAGGYSDRMPDLTYQQDHANSGRFEEKPGTQQPIFDGFVLRFRFAGWGRVQLATDPDPPIDEAGCTGTHMLHAADADLVFDRALVWQVTPPAPAFAREPADKLPEVGVNGVDVSLLIASAPASAGYMPIAVMQPTSAIQTSGPPADYCTVTGLNPVMSWRVEPGALRFDLLTKDGIRPFLNGMNHITSQDGEPIDPFVFSVTGDSQTLFQREVYNEGRTMLEMEPLQRLESSRQPCGFDGISSIPGWARDALTPEQRALIDDPAFPGSYLIRRCTHLTIALDHALDKAPADGIGTQADVDEIVSYAERLALLGDPPRTSMASDPPAPSTTEAWLAILLHYGHTLSGEFTVETGDNHVLGTIAKTGLALGPVRVDDRTKPNARWLVTYTKGVMDTDALSDFIYGELYVPLAVSRADQPLRFAYQWTIPGAAEESVKSYACTFEKPFWRAYDDVTNDRRSYQRPGDRGITETLGPANEYGYTYSVAGYPATDHKCSFLVSADNSDNVQLEWSFAFSCDDPGDITIVVGAAAADAALMLAALTSHFSPG